MELPVFLTARETATLLRLSRDKVYEMTRPGNPVVIPHARVGGRLLFDREELLAWVQSLRPEWVRQTLRTATRGGADE